MKLTVSYTTNHAPTNMEATLEHNKIEAKVFLRSTFPTKEYELEVADTVDLETLEKVLNANKVSTIN